MQQDINEIVQEYGSFVMNISFRMIENREIAKEAAQEAWIEIMNSLPSFKGNAKISTWIYSIAKRTIARYSKNERHYSLAMIRKYQNGVQEATPSDSELDTKQWVKQMCDQCVTGSIHCLTNQERLLYLLYDVACLKSNEIEKIMGISGDSIRKKMSRSRKKLHRFLSNQCILYNPTGNCRCRMVKHVKEIDLQKEFESIQNDLFEISYLLKCKKTLSKDEEYLKEICHKYVVSSTNTVENTFGG